MSLRLQDKIIEIDGHVYPLRCNMAVLERLQDGPGAGNIGSLMSRPAYQVIFEILEAMLADACEDNPNLPIVPMKRLKKLYSPGQLGELGIFLMFVEAMSVTVVKNDANVSTADTDKNPGDSGN